MVGLPQFIGFFCRFIEDKIDKALKESMKLKRENRIEFLILFVCCVVAISYLIYSVKNKIHNKEREIKILVNEAATNITSITTIYDRHLQLIKSRAEELLSEDFKDNVNFKNRLINITGKGWELQPDKKDSLTFVGRITGTGTVQEISQEELQEIYLAEKLNKLFAQAKLNLPHAPFIYYTSRANFWNLTPRHAEDFSFFIENYLTYDLYTFGLPKNNPDKNIFWTKPYLDAGGNGIMVTAGIPLYDKDNFKGTICIDMLFTDIADYLKSNIFTNRNVILIDNYSQVVSSTVEQFASLDTILTLQDLTGDIRNDAGLYELNKFGWHNKDRIFVLKVPNTQWYIMHFEKRIDFLKDIISAELPVFASVLFLLVIIYLLLYSNRLRIENEKAKIKAENANSTKDKFLSIIAHDLRSPFSGLLGFSDLLYDNLNNNDAEQQKRYIRVIHEQIRNFHKLLENLLIWVQFQKEGISFNPVELALHNIAEETLEPLKPLADNKLIQLFNNIPREIKVVSDKSMLDTIIRNLVSNAIKFTPKSGKIYISAKIKDQYVELKIMDNGTGISKDKIAELFEISKKTSTKGTEGESGTGLGLILCKEFVELQRGEIWVESEGGKGTAFYFSIPLKD